MRIKKGVGKAVGNGKKASSGGEHKEGKLLLRKKDLGPLWGQQEERRLANAKKDTGQPKK